MNVLRKVAWTKYFVFYALVCIYTSGSYAAEITIGLASNSSSPSFAAESLDGQTKWFEESVDADDYEFVRVRAELAGEAVTYRYQSFGTTHSGNVARRFCFIACGWVGTSILTGIEQSERVQLRLDAHTAAMAFSPISDRPSSNLLVGLTVFDGSIEATGLDYVENASGLLPLLFVGIQTEKQLQSGSLIFDGGFSTVSIDALDSTWLSVSGVFERPLTEKLVFGAGLEYQQLSLEYVKNMQIEYDYSGWHPMIYLKLEI